MKNLIKITFFLFSVVLFSQNTNQKNHYKIWDNIPAPNNGKDNSKKRAGGYPYDQDWEQQSYPIGNGFMGANIFGRTDTERIQITEKTLGNEGLYGLGGLTNFEEIYLDFNHQNPKNYIRSLDLDNAILNVSYDVDNVRFTREYFANYPDNVIVIKLEANKKGKLSFTLRPEIPYLRNANEANTRTGTVIAEKNLITLSGSIPFYSCNYESQIKIINQGGKLIAENTNGKGTVSVQNANSVVIIISAGTNYVLDKNIFQEYQSDKKLDAKSFPHQKISKIIENATKKGYNSLKETHLKDFKTLFSRVNVHVSDEILDVPTKTLLENYKKDDSQHYLEELMFQFGRYLLISSSRKGSLPTGLQGVWSQYEVTPWTGGYWHNINIQMNYWGAFNTNLAETFLPYIDYFEAYYPEATKLATEYVKENNPNALSTNNDNGWTIGTGGTAYKIAPPGVHSGPGTGGLTTKLFWDYYDFTRDTDYLQKTGYPALLGMSKFLSKTLKPEENGLLLVNPSASPEQKQNGKYYITKGSTFDQGLVWETYHDLLKASEILKTHDEFLKTAKSQIDHLDPILIGNSGQIKEYREENNYGEIGEKTHRHVSHLCTLYPGTLINSQHPDWIKGVITSLDFRGNQTTGWAMAHRMNLRARTKEAEKAHEVYAKFLKERTFPNLWAFHPPFQIDGNFGTSAGVAEMLLQSQEGFIEPLPALPNAWKSGNFEGLMARGNFEISAKWKNGKANFFQIISKSGGNCILKYPDIKNAKITDKQGKLIPFKILENNKIEFPTEKMGAYFVGF